MTVNVTSGVVYQVELEAGLGAVEPSATSPAGFVDVTLTISIGSEQFQLSTSPIPPQTNGKSLGACACPVGNPIDVGSGNKFESIVDYHTAGLNQLSFARYYNSLGGSGPFDVELGNNWRSTYDRYLVVSPSIQIADGIVIVGGAAATVSAYRANGQVLNFTGSGGHWVTDTDVDVQLVQTGATTWTLTDHDDTVETYTVSASGQGLLTSIQARNGYTQTLQYNAAGTQLTSVTDSYNRTLTFTYAGGLLQTVTTPDGLVLTYTYTAAGGGNQLTSVSYSTTPATSQTYLYENASLPFALTGIIDEDGNRYATWSYDTYGRGLSSQHAGGADLTTISYDDTTGNRTVTNALGEQMLYKFTTLQNVPKVIEIDRQASSTTAAATKTFTYDANGYPASVNDWNGNLTTFLNDVHGQPTSINEASGTAQARTTTITYLSNYRLPVSVVTPGLTTTYTYDASGNPLTKTDTDTTTTTVPYSTSGTARTTTYTWSNFLPASAQGPRTDVKELTTYTFDSTGALTAVTNALNQTIKLINHLPGGLPQTIVDPNGVNTNLAFDARNRLLSSSVVTTAGSLVTSFTYDPSGNLISVTQPDGSSLANTYDAAHRLTGVTDLFNQSISYTLDALGDRTQTNVADTTGTVRRAHSDSFDALGRTLQDMGGVGQTTVYTYDGDGNALTTTDPLNHQTKQTIDALNRPVTSTDPAGNVTHIGYDAHDRVVSVTDPNGGTTTYVYDGFGDLIQQVSPTTGTTVYRYDLAGNLLQRVDARGAIANYTYDALDRVATTAYPGDAAENITYTYDQTGHGFGIGRLTSVADAVGTLSRSYDERGDVLSESRVQSGATLASSYAYDAAQRILSVGYPSGWTAAYSRDAMGRVTGVTTKAAGTSAKSVPVVSGIGYEPFGPPNALSFGNGVAETRSFDLDYRETSLSDTGKNPVQQLGYSYDLADNVSSITNAVTAANSQVFGYDALNRLTSAAGSYGTLGYTYDPIGNRSSDTSPATFPVLDGLGSINGLAYNQAGRVSAVTAGTNQIAGYTYDAFGHRLARSGANAGLYQYDLSGHLLEETDGQANPQADYIYLGNQPIASVSPVSGNVYFLHDDRLGTPQVATDSSQTIQWTANYQPFGATNTGIGLIVQDLRLPGQEFDSVTGWNHNGFREYAPGLGRYLESDPTGIAAGLNTYTYGDNSPEASTDPTGLHVPFKHRGDPYGSLDQQRWEKLEKELLSVLTGSVGIGFTSLALSAGSLNPVIGIPVLVYAGFKTCEGLVQLTGSLMGASIPDLLSPGTNLAFDGIIFVVSPPEGLLDDVSTFAGTEVDVQQFFTSDSGKGGPPSLPPAPGCSPKFHSCPIP
jgi:RHS repeat-associated protein